MKLKHQILMHIVLWIIFLGLPVTSALLSEKETPGLQHYLIAFGLVNVLNFYTTYIIMSRFMVKKSRSLQMLWLLIPIAIVFTGLRLVADLIIEKFYPDPNASFQWLNYIIVHFVNVLVYSLIAMMVAFFVGWLNIQRQKDDLVRQSREAELALLRSQINPHFLFNTLNNLYSLVSRKSDEAPGALMKLSEILRYMLYDCNADKVLLISEITYIKSYIELQQLRLAKPDFIKFTVNGDPGGKMIPPMLLINFVENAFKHGSKLVESPGIVIDIHNEPDEFRFEISNFITESEIQNKDPEKGIGLKNIKRRLDLTYPGKYKLHTGRKGDQYFVQLNLTGI